MKIESVMRSINRRMGELHDAFGVNSEEYRWASNMWWNVVKSAGIPIGVRKDGVFLIRRGKDVMEHLWENPVLEENLRTMWGKMKQRGTVRQILEKEYFNQSGAKEWMQENGYTVSDMMNEPEVMADVRGMAAMRGDKAYNDDDIYEDSHSELDDADNMDDIRELGDIISRFHDTGAGLAKDEKWEDIKRMWHDYQHRKEREDAMRAAETELE